MKRIKGVLLFIAFISIALGLVLQPDLGVMHYLNSRGIAPETVATLFAISGCANLIIGLRKQRWNAVWFAVFFAYTAMMWVAVFQACPIPVAQAVSHTLLSCFLVIELLEGGKWKT